MKKALVVVTLLAAVSAAQAVMLPYIVESRSGGLNYSQFSNTGGWSTSTGNVTAPGCTATIGSMYSSTGSFFGPNRQAVFSFTPSETRPYDISLAWTSTAGQTDTAVVLYTGASYGADLDEWGNAGPGGVVARTKMDMYYKGTGVWNAAFTNVALTAGTTYKVGIYGGHVTTAVAGTPNRVAAGAVKFDVPEPTTMLFVGLGIAGLITRRRSA